VRAFARLDNVPPFDGTDGHHAPMPKPLSDLVQMLRQIIAGLNAFEDTGVVAALDRVRCSYADGSSRPFGQALKDIARLFVLGGTDAVTMPSHWPTIAAADASAIKSAALKGANKRLTQILPRQGRFERPGARYQVRGFIRVKRDDGCPPKIVWAERYSEAFTIAAWHEKNPLVPPTQITLPAVTKDNASSFLPNVAFNVPKGIFKLLQKNSPDDFLKGNAQGDDSDGLDWICGFNIPIITLCAFIVLNIFISLFNIVFFWSAFIKICIPVPKALKDKLPNGLTS